MFHQRFPWIALLVATGILAGCGGESDDSADTPELLPSTVAGIDPITRAPAPAGGRPSIVAGRNVTFTLHDGNEKPVAPEDFQRHDMKAFRGGWHQSYANASLKLLISAIDPQPLLEHLENYRKSTQNPEEGAAAGRFIDLIHEAYNAFSSVDTRDFIKQLQNLAPFDRRNAAGDWEFKLDSDVFSTEKDPEQFLALISELFRLDTLPGWFFDIEETYVYQGEERAKPGARNRFEVFQVPMERIAAADAANFRLQRLIDLLHADQAAQVQWNEGDAQAATVKVRRQVIVEDVENFKRLTIGMKGSTPHTLKFSLAGSATLPVIDRKTGRKLMLTLAPAQALVSGKSDYAVRISKHDGQWLTHREGFVSPTRLDEEASEGRLINFAVTSVAPAP